MSDLIKKFRPPAIKRRDLENGVRYVETQPQADFVGQFLAVGDFVVYSRTVGKSANLAIAKVIGMYTKVDGDGRASSRVSIAVPEYWGNKIRRQSTFSEQLIKLLPEQHTDGISEDLMTA